MITIEKEEEYEVDKIVIPRRGYDKVRTSTPVRLDDKAYMYANMISNQTGWSLKKVVSMIVEQAFERGLIDFE